MTILIDSHAHLDMPEFKNDRDEVINRALNSGVKLIINVGATLEGSIRSVALASNYGPIYASVGVHPHDAGTVTEKTYKKLKELLKNEKVVAIGETGLDYYRGQTQKESQKRVFKEQLTLAAENALPVIIHTREAKEDTLSILKAQKHPVKGVLHCFSGDLDMATEAMKMGLYISFSGPITYPNATPLREVMKKIPLNRLLIETDCPYLAPQIRRGKRNEPAWVGHIAQKICEIKGVSADELSSNIQTNIKSLFNISVETRENIFSYKIRDSLYINLTNRCTSECVFCARKTRPVVKGYDLTLKREPESDELIKEIGDPKRYKEVVFCGYGEPTLRLDTLIAVAKAVRKKGGKVRLNTNGHGNLIHKRNILPDLKGVIDSVSISLNSGNKEEYNALNVPVFGNAAFDAVKEFALEAVKNIPDVVLTVVNVPGKTDISKCEKIAEEVGAGFRVRDYNVTG